MLKLQQFNRYAKAIYTSQNECHLSVIPPQLYIKVTYLILFTEADGSKHGLLIGFTRMTLIVLTYIYYYIDLFISDSDFKPCFHVYFM